MELRKHLFPEAELVDGREGHTDRGDKRVAVCSGGVEDQRMCGHGSHGKTVAKRMTAKRKAVKEELRKKRHEPLGKTGGWLAGVIRGATNDYAVPGNRKAVRAFYTQVGRLWILAIRRRSQPLNVESREPNATIHGLVPF